VLSLMALVYASQTGECLLFLSETVNAPIHYDYCTWELVRIKATSTEERLWKQIRNTNLNVRPAR
jgi:hypothetical protein